jgi:hypothetical protein
MPNPGMKHRRVVHKSTAGILKSIPEAVDPVGNPPPGLTTKIVALRQQRGTANRRLRPPRLLGLDPIGIALNLRIPTFDSFESSIR